MTFGFAAIICIAIPARSTGNLLASLPTPVLIGIEWTLGTGQPRVCRRELDARLYAGRIKGGVAEWYARVLVRDLFDDEIKGNADRAEWHLDQLWPDSHRALEATVVSDDRQARMIAASILRRHCFSDPSDGLLRACIEDLRHDLRNVNFLTLYNAQDAANYLDRYPDRIESMIADALESDDLQQRIAVAAIAGKAGFFRLAERAVPILTEQLRADNVSGNATMSAPGLIRFGIMALPYLHEACNSDDPQERSLALFIRDQIRHPHLSPLRLHNPPPRITPRTYDLGQLTVADSIRGFWQQ
ncbi:MAG: hypothetical protein AB7N71_14560 [Phycisphaerae bacterium]